MASQQIIEAVDKDINTVRDLRQRRKRRRQRRKAKKNNSMSTKKKIVNRDSNTRQTSIYSLISPSVRDFAEAVVCPFGAGAVGALRPDRYASTIIPMLDKFDLDITPDLLGASDTGTDASVLSGVIVWFEPRCTAAGTMDLNSTNDGFLYPCNYYSPTGTLDIGQSITAYHACITGLWILPAGTYKIGIYAGGVFDNAAYKYTFARYSGVHSNNDAVRILGAGIKLWGEEAPLNMGGYSFGGWLSLESFMSVMYTGNGTGGNSLQTSLRYRCDNMGIAGVTVRYSSIQSPTQVKLIPPSISSRNYTATSNAYITFHGNYTPQAADLCESGDYLPFAIWRFNNVDANNGPYTLKLSMVAHVEGVPAYDSPFIAQRRKPDLSLSSLSELLEDKEEFPVATKGHSFKSFANSAKKFYTKVNKTVGRISNMMNSIDKFVNKI